MMKVPQGHNTLQGTNINEKKIELKHWKLRIMFAEYSLNLNFEYI